MECGGFAGLSQSASSANAAPPTRLRQRGSAAARARSAKTARPARGAVGGVRLCAQVGRNWLSSGGEVRAKSAADVEITFDSFWVGGAPEGDGPRADPSSGSEADRRPLDGLINSVGKAVRHD